MSAAEHSELKKVEKNWSFQPFFTLSCFSTQPADTSQVDVIPFSHS
jgi:hypothetical protein